MSEEELLKKIMQIKKTGEPCPITEARKYYYAIMKEEQKELNQGLGMLIINLTQQIPITKVTKDDYDLIMDDLTYIKESITDFIMSFKVTYELYHHPDKYNAWKGEIEGETVYFIEPKELNKKEEIGSYYI